MYDIIKSKVHYFEQLNDYDSIHSIISYEIDKKSISQRMYRFLLSEIIFILEEYESPKYMFGTQKYRFNHYFDLLVSLVDRIDLKEVYDKYTFWYFCYYLYNYARFHCFIDIYGGINQTDVIRNELFELSKIRFPDSLLFDIIPEISEYCPDPATNHNEVFLSNLRTEIIGFEFGDVYVDQDFKDSFEPYLKEKSNHIS